LALSTFALSSAFSPWGLTKQSRVVLFGEVKKEKIDVVYDTDFTGVDLGRIYGRDRLKRKMRRNEIRRSSTIDSSVNKAIRLIIAGAPASGKGTQCEIIKKKYGVVHLSTGDMLRAAVAAQTEVGKAAKEFMDSGKLVPDSVIIGVVSIFFSLS
jgi:adenylate kinase